MLSLKPQIGKKAGPYYEQVSAQRIAAFARAVGAQDLNQVPPTFMTVFRRGEFELMEKIGVQLSQVLHTEQEYEYWSEIQAGDHVRFETELSQVLEKQSATLEMQFLTFQTTVYIENSKSDTESRASGRSKTVIVIRNVKTPKEKTQEVGAES